MLKSLSLVCVSLGLAQTALAFPSYLENFSGHYSSNGIDVSGIVSRETCATCHQSQGGGGARNPYGRDFKSITLGRSEGFPGIEFLDSDVDSYLNLEEIFLGTAPGKAEDTPVARITLEVNGDTLQVTLPQATAATASAPATLGVALCKNLELKAFGFKFADVESKVFANATGSFKVPVTGDKGAILVRCIEEAAVGSLLVK